MRNNRAKCQADNPEIGSCFWCDKGGVSNCYEDLCGNDKIFCRRNAGSCEDFGCQENDVCSDKHPDWTCIAQDDNTQAGDCPADFTANNNDICQTHSTKSSCIVVKSCSWCNFNGEYKCITDKDKTDGGECPMNYFQDCLDNDNPTEKDSCMVFEDCAWCGGIGANHTCVKEKNTCDNYIPCSRPPNECERGCFLEDSCKDVPELKDHPCLANRNNDESAGLCPDDVNKDSVCLTIKEKQDCISFDVNGTFCAWCDIDETFSCVQESEKLNKECADLIICRDDADEKTCPENCVWVPLNSDKCNDPAFTGCFATADEESDAGICPNAIEACPTIVDSKEACLEAGCSWCDGECRDPNAELNKECADLIVCRNDADEETCPKNCVWVPLNSDKCNDPKFAGCFATPGEESDAGICPNAIEACSTSVDSKKACLEAGCSWCDGECRNPDAKLNQECADLIVCRDDVDEETCPENCEWVPLDSDKCNDPTFTGCFADDNDMDAGSCPKAIEQCPDGAFGTKKECLQNNCSWCEGECRDPSAEYYGQCEGNIRRQRINLENATKESCIELGNTKWCDGVCLAAYPRLLRPYEV